MPNLELERQFIEHLKTGVTACLVCGKTPMSCDWTDLHGEAKCTQCGMAYQIKGAHRLNEEWLARNSLSEDSIKFPYCHELDLVPILTDYWNATKNFISLGTYAAPPPERIQEAGRVWRRWLKANITEYRAKYPDLLAWDRIAEWEPD